MIRSDGRLSRSLLGGMLLAVLLTPFGSTMIAVALPEIGRVLGEEPARLNLWLVVSYLLVAIAGQSPGGMLGDRVGHERVLLGGIGLHALGAILGTLAGGLAGLGAARVLAAAGGAVTIPAAMALLRNRLPAGRRPRAFGLLGGAMSLAAALGPPAGALLVDRLGWRAIFAVNLPLAAAAALPVIRAARASLGSTGGIAGAREAAPAGARPAPGESAPAARGTDLVGSALLVLGLAPIVLALAPASGLGAGALVAGLTILAGFLAWESRTRDPILDPRLFRRKAFAAGGLLIALHNLAMYGLLFLIPAALASRTATGAARPGLVLPAMLGAMAVAPSWGGRLAGRAGARATTLAGSLLALGGFALVHALGAGAGEARTLIGLALLGTGLGLASAPAQASAMSAVPAGASGAAAGALTTMRYLGGLAGIALVNAGPAGAVPRPAFLAALAAATLVSLRLPGRGRTSPDGDAESETPRLRPVAIRKATVAG